MGKMMNYLKIPSIKNFVQEKDSIKKTQVIFGDTLILDAVMSLNDFKLEPFEMLSQYNLVFL